MALLLLCSGLLYAQETSIFWIHEDMVKPSKYAEYEEVAKELVTKATENKMAGPGWMATSTDDFRYYYITPIQSLSDISWEPMMELRDKAGAEAFDAMMGRMNSCYDNHIDYVLDLHPELSYMPDGMSLTTEGKPFRKYFRFTTTPDQMESMLAVMKKIKTFWEDKKSKVHYRIYSSGFGAPESYVMVAMSAKDELDMAQMDAENTETLGEEWGPLVGELLKYTTAYQQLTGRMRPDLSYSAR